MSWKPGEIAVGYVSAIDPVQALARVRFPDRDNLVSGWLQVGQSRTSASQSYAMPAVDEHVLVVLFGSGVERGAILCSLYDTANPPPESGAVVYTQSPGGDTIAFHLATGQLIVSASGGVTITGDVTVTGTLAVIGDITATGDVAATGDVTAGIISLKTHTHISASPGNPTSVPTPGG